MQHICEQFAIFAAVQVCTTKGLRHVPYNLHLYPRTMSVNTKQIDEHDTCSQFNVITEGKCCKKIMLIIILLIKEPMHRSDVDCMHYDNVVIFASC